ncbi:hypothetical protein DFJ73DRAFT_843395 [Zopfochytrium polystomum]|nr:hypothetical protein DFJ73DRAFT_843395 [Zopfochytrium polystomum]
MSRILRFAWGTTKAASLAVLTLAAASEALVSPFDPVGGGGGGGDGRSGGDKTMLAACARIESHKIVDAYELRSKRRKRSTPATPPPTTTTPTDLPVDLAEPSGRSHTDPSAALADALLRTPFLVLERAAVGAVLPALRGLTPDPTGRYEAGTRVSGWTVVGRTADELVMRWSVFGGSGYTWVQAVSGRDDHDGEEGEPVLLRFGSATTLPTRWSAPVQAAVTLFHSTYSKVLLLTVAASVWVRRTV